MQFDRVKKLFGKNFEAIKNANIIILGVGGVGGFALDALYRTGIRNITIVDFDIFDETNQNRQIGSFDGIGKLKVEHLATIYKNIKTINEKITKQWIDDFDFSAFDFILDAIDDIEPKVHLISKYYKKVISSGGSAKRIDPLKIEYIDISKTHSDPFVRKIRQGLKKIGFNKKFNIIFSNESPICDTLGSFVGVTGAFGLAMSSITVQKIISKYELK